jgi:hypothetical protein
MSTDSWCTVLAEVEREARALIPGWSVEERTAFLRDRTVRDCKAAHAEALKHAAVAVRGLVELIDSERYVKARDGEKGKA